MIFVLLTHHHVNGFGSVSFLTNLSLSLGHQVWLQQNRSGADDTSPHLCIACIFLDFFLSVRSYSFSFSFSFPSKFLVLLSCPLLSGHDPCFMAKLKSLRYMGKGLRISLLFTYPYHHQFFFTFHIPIPVYACFPFPLGSYPRFPNTFILLFL